MHMMFLLSIFMVRFVAAVLYPALADRGNAHD